VLVLWRSIHRTRSLYLWIQSHKKNYWQTHH